MKANNTIDKLINVHTFREVKVNKHSTIFQRTSDTNNSFITNVVKIEKFQGYSIAYNLGEYFRIINASSWAKSKQVTGLWKSSHLNYFYGDNKTDKGKTLLIFFKDDRKDFIAVYEFVESYYPSKVIIERIINNLL